MWMRINILLQVGPPPSIKYGMTYGHTGVARTEPSQTPELQSDSIRGGYRVEGNLETATQGQIDCDSTMEEG